MRRENTQQDLFIEAPVWWQGLKPRQKRFVETYCTDKTCFLNATTAYIKAYGGAKAIGDDAARAASARLLRDPLVKDAIGRLLKAAQAEEDRLSEHQVLNIIKTLATYNPADIIDRHGNLKLGPQQDLNDLGPLALCVSGIKRTRHGIEIKLYDRTKAAAMLAQYLELIRPMEIAAEKAPIVGITPKEARAAEEAEDAEYRIVQRETGEKC